MSGVVDWTNNDKHHEGQCCGVYSLNYGTEIYSVMFSRVHKYFDGVMRHVTRQSSGWGYYPGTLTLHYNDVTMVAMASQLTGVSIVYSTVCSGTGQRKHQGSASLAFVRGIHRSPVNSPHKGPVTQKMFPFDDVIMVVKFLQLIWKSGTRRFHLTLNNLLAHFALIMLLTKYCPKI